LCGFFIAAELPRSLWREPAPYFWLEPKVCKSSRPSHFSWAAVVKDYNAPHNSLAKAPSNTCFAIVVACGYGFARMSVSMAEKEAMYGYPAAVRLNNLLLRLAIFEYKQITIL
jgi:hypothetical protein